MIHQLLRSESGQSRGFLDVRVEASLDGVKASSGNWRTLPGCSWNVSGDVCEWPTQQQAQRWSVYQLLKWFL